MRVDARPYGQGTGRARPVSVRTLHHYDAVGLLTPAGVGANGYRYDGREELLRLQEIRVLRALDMGLAEIAEVLSAGGRTAPRGWRHIATGWSPISGASGGSTTLSTAPSSIERENDPSRTNNSVRVSLPSGRRAAKPG